MKVVFVLMNIVAKGDGGGDPLAPTCARRRKGGGGAAFERSAGGAGRERSRGGALPSKLEDGLGGCRGLLAGCGSVVQLAWFSSPTFRCLSLRLVVSPALRGWRLRRAVGVLRLPFGWCRSMSSFPAMAVRGL
jgi:hypothetical protein